MQVYLDFKKLKIVGGLRTGFNTLFKEPIIIPRIAILYSINSNHSFRISSGQAYKPPAGNLLFQSLAFPINPDNETDSVMYSVIPNTNLQPEYFEAHEFGYRGAFFKKNILIDFAFYYNTVKNLIISTFINPKIYYDNAIMPEGEFSRFYLNNKDALTQFYGIDVVLTIKNIYKPKNINATISGTYTFGSERLSSGETIKYLRGIPTYMFKINFYGNPTRRFYIKIENTIMSGWKRSFLPNKEYYQLNSDYPNIKGYYIADVILGYRIHKNLNIFAKISNIFNSKYGGIDATSFDIDLRYNPQMGENLRLGLTFIMN
jgi:outer membrane receptor protein involved in Fe transport